MRFFALATLALASVAIAAPTQKHAARSLLTDIGAAISDLEDQAGITALEADLDELLGGSLTKLEEKLGVTFAEKLLQLSKEGASKGDLQAIGKGVYYLEEGLGIHAVDELLDEETGGAVTSLEEALGVTDLEAALGIEA